MTKEQTLQSNLSAVFKKIQKREVFESPTLADLKSGFDDAILSAALSKCLDLNVIINDLKLSKDNSFLFIANLRGVVEDLIVLSFVKNMDEENRLKYLSLIHFQGFHKGLLTQVKFFQYNNPFQPIFGDSISNLEEICEKDRGEIRAFWKNIGEIKKDGPTVRDMAERTGLIQTYEYIYFLSSNFVHFNPNTLLRTGWGADEGPYRFSVRNFSGYYADLGSFYGAVLFIGFYSRLGEGKFSKKCDNDVDRILEIIDSVPRWPEIVTFEEMNKKPPFLSGFFARGMRKTAQEQDTGVPYGAILREVRALS